MRYYLIILVILSSMLLTSCEAIGDIFGAGVYVGVFISVLVVAILIYLFYKIFKR